MDATSAAAAGTITIAGRPAPRLGYGAMRLPGPEVWGPPADREQALAVCRRAVELGIRVIDTAWFYGDDVANEILAAALRPYPDGLLFITKLGGARTPDGGWISAHRPDELRAGCERDLRVLGVESVPVAHLRWMEGHANAPFSDALGTMLELRDEGKIRHIGLSTVGLEHIATARALCDVASVSNAYSPLDRSDEAVVDHCTEHGIPYLPYFPLAIGSVATDTGAVADVAAEIGATPVQVALAWLLARSPIMLPIPGTSDPAHLDENVAAGAITLPGDARARLDAAGVAAGG